MTLYHASGSRARALTYYKRKKRERRARDRKSLNRLSRFGRRPWFARWHPKRRYGAIYAARNALYLSYEDR